MRGGDCPSPLFMPKKNPETEAWTDYWDPHGARLEPFEHIRFDIKNGSFSH